MQGHNRYTRSINNETNDDINEGIHNGILDKQWDYYKTGYGTMRGLEYVAT